MQEELGSPALAFTRTVCEVLALDGCVAEEVAVLRRNLLRLTHTREFSPQAVFRVRGQHACSACMHASSNTSCVHWRIHICMLPPHGHSMPHTLLLCLLPPCCAADGMHARMHYAHTLWEAHAFQNWALN